ncbi:MAG TPA: fumarylacetoacetate hydrolase family protein [bacterium]|jgi:2-keto-4-pentenoate hydratase/2-oxohepta-3-ene-1,7-dioic acid hydratase in catechol pathway|nr:fumarylacetoacetate hydrolase family protein [Myxococcales bacterium]OQA62287.1 MAG: Ureidoglycolate lyase [bacterium ADurb.Bin270]HPW45119.1 fumarylacetoacetate hydrolase family protein [bacterium]HQG13597.1 fumarylacetoacetate hydrolase family protein [bacterium]HQH80589.1 fumarylacetoacetate hydrolase family protein [bacterium]
MKKIIFGEVEISPSKIVCVGKNYRAHIAEMGGAGAGSEPAIFIKPNSAISFGEDEIVIPESFGLIHYEVELCMLIGDECSFVKEADAMTFVSAYCVGLDLTLRDMQSAAKKFGWPWTLSKGFNGSAPIGGFIPASKIPDPMALEILLKVNGDFRQRSNTSQMIFSPAKIISYISSYITLEAGDIVMTGTPEGVGPLYNGDSVIAEIEPCPSLQLRILRT